MREIKYRAWDKVNNIMFNACFVGIGKVFSMTKTFKPSKQLENVIVMQYTGLKDKNGVEVYEGDIVGSAEDWGIVIWCDKCIGWQLAWYDSDVNEKRCHMCDGNFDITETFENGIADNGEEVIGNIYENPELLDKD